MAPVLPLAPLERVRLYPPVHNAFDAPSQPRVLLFAGMAGSGKTVASRLYLRRLAWPAVVIEPGPDQDHGWPLLQNALAALGLPAAQPLAAIADIGEPTVFVIDPFDILLDAQGAPLPVAAPWLTALLDNSAIQLILVSRVVPNFLQLALLTANGQLQIIDGQALAFQLEEAQALWRLRQGSELSRDRAAELVAQSGGHAATIALACATGSTPVNGHSSFQEVLAAEILNQVPEDLLVALRDLTVLSSLSPAMVEALTGISDGEGFLRRLRGFGLIGVDTPIRLHPLVRQALLKQLRADRQRFAAVTQRAITLLSNMGDDESAWALARSAELWDAARQLVLAVAPRLRQQGQSRLLVSWIETIPPAERTTEISILMARAMAEYGDLDGAVIVLSELRAMATNPDDRRAASLWLANALQTRGEIEAADEIVRAYLDEGNLTGVWRAYALRIRMLAMMYDGREELALEFGQQTIMAAQAVGDRRLMAFAYQDTGVIADRAGRSAEAESLLRFAERCWRDLGNPPEMAITLNELAMLQLKHGNATRALELAQEARLRALAGSRPREAAIASATCGDAAFAQGQAAEALRYYQVAAEEAERGAVATTLSYSLAFIAHAARFCGNRDYADRALGALLHLITPSLETRAWRATGIAAAQLTLRLPSDDAELRHALDLLGPHEAEVRGPLLILAAHVAWAQGDRCTALARWAEVEELTLRGRGGDRSRLAPLAACQPALLREALAAGPSSFAALILERFPDREQPKLLQNEVDPTLLIRVLGGEAVTWQGKAVTLPKHGLALLVLLLTSSTPLEDDELIRLLWGEQGVGWETLKKLVQRIRAQMPDSIRRIEGRYVLALPRTAIDFDLDHVLTIEIQDAPTERLRSLAEAGRDILGAEPEHGTWRAAIRDTLRRRLALIWLELGRRAAAEGAGVMAGEAFAQAQRADPTSDLVARAAMQSALELGDRALAIQIYLRYQQALDDQLGVDPARDLQELYRQAMEP